MINGQGSFAWSPSRAAARRAAKRSPRVYPVIDLMPFLGVFLVLLFIFMCVVPPYHASWQQMNLPKAQSATLQPGAVREDAIRIAVTRDGRFFFDSVEAEAGDLPNLIRTAMRCGSERKVYLLADSRAKNGDVEIVVDQIRLSGITDVVILANRPSVP
jgi:biopolymer transport protein TolR